MVIALLVVLGVNLAVIVAFVTLVAGRRRWLKRQPGEFAGAARVTSGHVHDASAKWKRGSGRWVHDVLVWSKAPFMFRTALVPVDRVTGERDAAEGEVKRLGDHPHVVEFVAGDVTIEVAASAEQRALIVGPFAAQAIN